MVPTTGGTSLPRVHVREVRLNLSTSAFRQTVDVVTPESCRLVWFVIPQPGVDNVVIELGAALATKPNIFFS